MIEKTLQIKGVNISSLKDKDKIKLEGIELLSILNDVKQKDKIKVIDDSETSEWTYFHGSAKTAELISISYVPGCLNSLKIREGKSGINLEYKILNKFRDAGDYYQRMGILTKGMSTIIHYLQLNTSKGGKK